MNNEQIERIKQEIDNLKDLRRIIAAFIIPIFSGIIVAIASKDFLGNLLYRSLAAIGAIMIILGAIGIFNLNKRIKSFIKQLI